MQAFAQLAGAFPSRGHVKIGWLLQLLQIESGLVLAKLQHKKMRCWYAQHLNVKIQTHWQEKCRE